MSADYNGGEEGPFPTIMIPSAGLNSLVSGRIVYPEQALAKHQYLLMMLFLIGDSIARFHTEANDVYS